MRYINTLREGMRTADIYLYKNKQIALTKNDKEYGNPVIRDRTDIIGAKIWDLDSPGVREFRTMNYAHMEVDVALFQSFFQLNVRRIRRAQEGEYVEVDYLPMSKGDTERVYKELLGYVRSVKDPHLQRLLSGYFAEDTAFVKAFQFHFAAKTVHYGFVGGLLEHTLSVTKLCDYYAGYYPMINRDLLLTAATFHDIGKTREPSRFPENDYIDDGQLLGRIIIGIETVGESICSIPGFLEKLVTELKHCTLVHHGELEHGFPEKPVLLEALAPNFANSTDAKMKIVVGTLQSDGGNKGWLGYSRLLESNIRKIMEWALRPDNIER